MTSKEKFAVLAVFLAIISWILTLIILPPADKVSYLRDIVGIAVLLSLLTFISISMITRLKRITNISRTLENVLVDDNYFPIMTSENEEIIFANKRFLNLCSYKNIIFLAGRKISSVFKTETYEKIKEFLNSPYIDGEINWKYISGYVRSRDGSFIPADIIIQKFIINGRNFNHYDIIEKDISQLLISDIPVNINLILNNLKDPILYLDKEHNIKWANNSATKLLNKNLSEIIGEKCYKVFYNENHICKDCPTETALSKDDSSETVIRLPNGRYYNTSSQILRNERGEAIGVIKVMRDITGEREIEIKRWESEAKLSLISEQLPTLIWIVDENLRVTYVSGAVLKRIDIKKEELLSKTLYEILNTSDANHPIIKNTLLALTGESSSYQFKIRRRNYMVYCEPFKDPEGKIVGCIGLSHDITELVNIQRELEEKNRILYIMSEINKIISYSKNHKALIRNILKTLTTNTEIAVAIILKKDSARDIIVVEDIEPQISDMRGIFETSLTSTNAHNNPLVLSYLDQEIKSINDIGKSDLPPNIQNILIDGGYNSIIFLPVIIEDRVQYILTLLSKVKDYFLNSDYYKDIVSDIKFAIENLNLQEAKHANEEAIRKNQIMLYRAQKYEYASRLASQLAHDFNNILLSVSSYAELIRNSTSMDNKMEEYLFHINNAIKKGGDLTSYLMKYSTYTSLNKKELEIDRFDNELADTIKNLCISKSTKFVSLLEPCEGNIVCDIDRIKESIGLIARYLINRSNSNSTIELNIGCISTDEDIQNQDNPRMIRIGIMSDSPSLDEQFKDDMFEINTLNIEGEQPEFNLPIISNIIRLHGGYIYADSDSKKSGFIIILPLEYYGESDIKFNIPSNEKNILIVEDDAEVKEPLEIILRDLNCNILSASDGENALKLLKKMDYKIDILITDIEMPLIDGISLAEEIYRQNNRVKVIYISGYIKDFATREKRFVPNSIFLQKPFPLDVFKKIVIDTLKAEQQ